MKKLLTFCGALAFILLIAAGCSKDETGLINNNPVPNTIYMKNSMFNKDSLQVATGDAVIWVNDDNIAHTVTADDGSFDSGNIAPGASYTLTFNTIGTFYYHCKDHSSMKGVIKVLGR